MSSSLIVLFVICVGSSAAQTVTEDYSAEFNYRPTEPKYPECGPNEVLNKCVNCPGEDTCYDRGQIACPAAFLPCHPACVCKEGFIRKTVGRECIPKEECGAPCEIFEQYTECKECSNETCASIESPVKCDSKVPCTPGCTCWNGYYKEDKNSPCQHRCSCPELKDSSYCLFFNSPPLW